MHFADRYLPLAGRLALAYLFLWSGWGKITDFSGSLGYMEAYGMPFASLLLVGAIVFEVGGALLLITGYRARLGAAMLIAFTIPATLIFHNFWALEGMDRYLQTIAFNKNLAMIGGLLLVVRWGAGPLSLGNARDERLAGAHSEA
jgi:putative oxidoreductase